jgi:hypothetical protein
MGPVPTYSLADLRTAETQGVIETRLVAALAGRGLPTASWIPVESGGVELTTVRMVAGTLAKLVSAKLAQAVGGRFLDLATGDLLTYLAKHYYLIDRVDPTFTIQNVFLFSTPAAPSNSFQPGDVWVSSPATNNRYVNLDPIELPSDTINGVSARFQAELPGASYSDPAGTISHMVTAPAGVSCTNDRPSDYLPAHQVGTSTGQVLANRLLFNTGVLAYQSVRVRIETFGDVGIATMRYSVDGGVTWLPSFGAMVMPPTLTIPGPPGAEVTGVELFFENGVTPSFIQGSTFTLLAGNAILQQGNDAESDEALRARCRARWTSLSLVPTEGLVTLWAKLASLEIAKVTADAAPDIPGGMVVTLASAAGPASAAAQIAVSDYIEDRLLGFKGVPEAFTGAGSPQETVQVRSAVPHALTAGGVVDVPRASVAAVQQAADLGWLAYLRSLDIGGLVVLAELEQAIMDAGAINVSAATLNAVAANVQLGAGEVAVPADGSSLTANLSWRPV